MSVLHSAKKSKESLIIGFWNFNIDRLYLQGFILLSCNNSVPLYQNNNIYLLRSLSSITLRQSFSKVSLSFTNSIILSELRLMQYFII